MSEVIRCTACGAPAQDLNGTPERCHFCGSRFVPSSQRSDTVLDEQAPVFTNTSKKSAVTVPVLVVALFFTVGMAAAVFFLVTDSGLETMGNTLSDEVAFAEEIQRYGGEGTGAGKFTDNREVGLDAKGNIYSADYSGGRLQVLGNDGTFRTQWSIPKMPVQDLCVGRDGTVYICQQSQITAYEGASGKVLQQTGDGLFGTLTVLLDGSLLATTLNGDIWKLDKELNKIAVYENVMQKAGAETMLTTEITGNGMGEVFILDFMGKNVYHFSADLAFIDRFKTKGMMPNHVAVDEKGRIYVSSVTEIFVYNGEGEFLATFPTTQTFGMAFDDKGALWTASRPYILKYQINR